VKAIKITFYLFLFLVTSANAKQLNFSKHSEGDHYNFHYEWLDHSNQHKSINFTLTKAALFERFRILKPYQSEYSQKTIMHALKKQLTKKPLDNVQAFFVNENGKSVIQIKGAKDKDIGLAYQKVKEIEQEVTSQYFKKNYYQFFNSYNGERRIKIDHARIANNSVRDFKPIKSVILDQVDIKNIRNVTNYVLGFVQSIPYSTLESHITSSGSGFNAPAKLLWENQGDCDSKVTLTTTILRALMPRIDMVIIYIDQHAFMGIAIPANAGEKTIQHQGINYLLAEPTGPALYTLGVLAPDSALAISQGLYVAESFHSDGNY
jgi:hypothetical protein